MPTLLASLLFEPALPSSRTRAILRWLDTIGITFNTSFLNKSNLKSLWRGIQASVDYIPVKTLRNDFNTRAPDNFDNFSFCTGLNMKQSVLHASYATYIYVMHQIRIFFKNLRTMR